MMKKPAVVSVALCVAIMTVLRFTLSQFMLTNKSQQVENSQNTLGFFVPVANDNSTAVDSNATKIPTAMTVIVPTTDRVAKLSNDLTTAWTLVPGTDATAAKINMSTGRTTSVSTAASSSQSPFGEFFQLLCRYNVTACCREESRLEVLDKLSLTLGAAQTYDQTTLGKLPRPGPDPIASNTSSGSTSSSLSSLNCSRYLYESNKPFKGKGNITTTREVVNNFRRRLVFIPPTVNQQQLRPIFLGPAQKPRLMVDVLMVSHELDILQARMHQFYSVMDHFVIIESAYNHRGWRKHRFVEEELAKPNNRFQQFQDKMIYLDIDKCPMYLQEVEKERASGQGIGANVWPIQESMRECVWPTLKQHLEHLPDSALIMMADLDWLPCYSDLLHIRHCEPSEEYGGYNSHIRMGLKQKMRASFVRDEPGRELMNEKFSLTPLSRIRKDDHLPARGFPPNRGPHERRMTMHPIICGVHLQLMGSLANIIYREVTHAEGSYLDRFRRVIDGKNYCDIDDEFLRHQQERFSQHPEYFHWRHPPAIFEPANATATGPLQVSSDHLQALRDAQVPSVLFDHRKLYPFYWGQGTYDMYSENN